MSALGSIRSVRVLNKSTWPVLAESAGLAGARELHDGIYLHTDGSDQIVFKTQSAPATSLHLVSTNGLIKTWQRGSNGIEFRVAGEVPVELELSHAASACRIASNGQFIRGRKTTRNTHLFTFTTRDTGNAVLHCQA